MIKEKVTTYSEWLGEGVSLEGEKIKKCVEEGDTLSAILIAHSTCEIALRLALLSVAARLNMRLEKGDTDDMSDFSFVEILKINHYFGVLDDTLFSKFKELNAIRNIWVHPLGKKKPYPERFHQNIALNSIKLINLSGERLDNIVSKLDCRVVL